MQRTLRIQVQHLFRSNKQGRNDADVSVCRGQSTQEMIKALRQAHNEWEAKTIAARIKQDQASESLGDNTTNMKT